jgi:hypothetical protein
MHMGLVVTLVGGERNDVSNTMVLADNVTRVVLAIVNIDHPNRARVRVHCDADRARLRILRGTLLGRIPEIGEVLPLECFEAADKPRP